MYLSPAPCALSQRSQIHLAPSNKFISAHNSDTLQFLLCVRVCVFRHNACAAAPRKGCSHGAHMDIEGRTMYSFHLVTCSFTQGHAPISLCPITASCFAVFSDQCRWLLSPLHCGHTTCALCSIFPSWLDACAIEWHWLPPPPPPARPPLEALGAPG